MIYKKILFIFTIIFFTFMSKNVHSYENKILLKINDEILTSKDVLDHINYIMIINPNFNQLNSNQQFEISKNEMIKLKIKKIEISKKFRKYDLITNVFPRTFPKGQSVEIIKTSILKDNLKNFSKLDKEHVTKYFYDNATKFLIKNFLFRRKNNIFDQSVDTKQDLKNILKKLNKKKFENYYLK